MVTAINIFHPFYFHCAYTDRQTEGHQNACSNAFFSAFNIKL